MSLIDFIGKRQYMFNAICFILVGLYYTLYF